MKEKELGEARKEYMNSLITYKAEIEMLSEQNIKEIDYSKKLKKEIEDLRHKQSSIKQKHLEQME